MPMFRFWRLRKLIRDTSTPIAYEKAKKYDRLFGNTYNICAFTAFGLASYIYINQEIKKNKALAAEGKPIETNGQYWARKLGIHGAKVITFSLTGKKTSETVYLDPERVIEEQDTDKPKLNRWV